MPQITVRTLLTKSLLKAKVIGAEASSPNASYLRIALDEFNSLTEALALHNLWHHVRDKTEFTVSSGISSYSVGSAGDIEMSHPYKIKECTYVDSGIRRPIPHKSIAESLGIPQLVETSGCPRYFTYEPSTPNGELTFYPKPSSDFKITLHTNPSYGIYGYDDTLDLPTGYTPFLEVALGGALAGFFNNDVDEGKLNAQAVVQLDKIKGQNIQKKTLKFSSTAQQYDINTGSYR